MSSVTALPTKDRWELDREHDKWDRGEVDNAAIRLFHRKVHFLAEARIAAAYRPSRRAA